MKTILLSILVWLTPFVTQAQSNFTFTNLSGVNREGMKAVDVQSYPYMTVSVISRNQEKFGDKDYIKRFTKLKYLLVESEVSKSATESESAPLLFVEKNNGKFSQSMFVDRTIVTKIPVSIFSNQIPSVELRPTITYKNQAIALVKTLTSTLGPILQNPTSLYGDGAVNLVYGFLDDVVTNLDQNKTINLSVQFSAYKPEELKIKPRSYNIVIVNNSSIDTGGKKFVLKTDTGDNKLKLHVDDKLFTEHPYFIIEIGASNYFETPNIPSSFFHINGCNINEAQLKDLSQKYHSTMSKLTASQQLAENSLLSLYSIRDLIQKGEAAPFNATQDTDALRMTKAYDALYDFMDMRREQIDPILYDDHYKTIIEGDDNGGNGLTHCITNIADNLDVYHHVNDLYKTLRKEPKNIANNDLSTLHTYVDITKSKPYLTQSKFNSKTYTAIYLAERYIFENNFEVLIDHIKNASAISDQIRTDYKSLVVAKSQFNRCKRCMDEAVKAESRYTDLVNQDIALRQEMQNTLIASTEVLSNLTVGLSQKEEKLVGEADLEPEVSSKVISLQNLQKSINEKLVTIKKFTADEKVEINAELAQSGTLQADLNKIAASGGVQ